MQKAIFDYINFPNQVITISQAEMWKTKTKGGIKLINIQIKSETAKAKWLLEIATNDELKLNLMIFTSLLGQQKGNISGRDLIFLQTSYFKRQLKTDSEFYKEALHSLGRLEIKKGIPDLNHWDKEHIFYNPLFRTEYGWKDININK